MSDYIDIYSNSWGPADTGFTVERPGRLLSQTLENGVTYVCKRVTSVMHASTHTVEPLLKDTPEIRIPLYIQDTLL